MDFSTSEKPLTDFSLAGLADIILLLLIFFLLTSNFIPQFGIQVDLPETDTAAPADQQHISVSITDEGRFYVGQEEVPQDGLMAAIRAQQADHTALVLRADQEATVNQFAAVAGVARALNLRVLMATDREDISPVQ